MKLLSGRKRLQPHPAFAPFLRQVEALAQLLRSQTETEREEGRFWAAEAENRPYFAPLGSDRFRNVYFALPPEFATIFVVVGDRSLQQMTEFAGNSTKRPLQERSHDRIRNDFRNHVIDANRLFGTEGNSLQRRFRRAFHRGNESLWNRLAFHRPSGNGVSAPRIAESQKSPRKSAS